jgi:hypothetical protein
MPGAKIGLPFLIGTALVLSACNTASISEGLRVDASRQPAPNRSVGQSQQSASLGQVPPVSFLPVSGAPQSAVASLAGALRSAAESNSIPVVVSLQQGATYQLKGYFSALNDGKGTLLVYVWDVLDASGRRVHRISGQERTNAATGDPWAAVTPELLSRVANATMASLRGWVSGRAAG